MQNLHSINKVSFEEWCKNKEAIYRLEDAITIDMLSKGINGLEWLVLNTIVDEHKTENLHQFLSYLYKNHFMIKEIMADAIMMSAEDFYKENEVNWYIAIAETLTYLSLLRNQKYSEYLGFINSLYMVR